MSVFEQIEQLDHQRAQLIEVAKVAAMDKVREGIEELRRLGYYFELVDAADQLKKPAPKKTAAAPTDRKPADKECEVCGFKTVPPHDKRSHRVHPAAFTAEEIAAKGWKVAQ